MSSKCQMVVFSNKAYNAIIRESFDKDPVETGGILLGHILDNGVWIVMEVLPPGINCIFERAYFEYDDDFVNYLAQSVANQYKIPLELLGLWHRHPGSMDVFSSTDDGTNTTFALQNPSGVISGLVNIDPQFRLTMYYMENPRNVVRQYHRPNYECIDVEVGDDIIPEEYFQLKYYDGEGSNLNPFVERSHTRMSRSVRTEGSGHRKSNDTSLDIQGTIERKQNRSETKYESHNDESSYMRDLIKICDLVKKNKIISLVALILVIVSIFSFKTATDGILNAIEKVVSCVRGDENKVPSTSSEEITFTFGDDFILKDENVTKNDEVSDKCLATIDIDDKLLANKEGDAEITVNDVDTFQVEIEAKSGKSEDSALESPLFEIKPQSNMNPDGGCLNIDFADGTLLLYIQDGYNVQLLNDVSWESSNVNVANVECATTNDTCHIKFIGIGKTDINLLYKGQVVDTYKLELIK